MIQSLQKELVRLTEASKEGQLSDRGKPEQFQGAYAEIVRGVNTMLDAILLPIGEGNRILAQISTGKIDELIAQTYKGDHEKMKQAVNNVAIVLQGLQKELVRLIEASQEGQLSERGKPEQFQGAYAEIVRGVNAMLDAILLPIGEGNRILAQISIGQDRRADRADLQGRSRKDEGRRSTMSAAWCRPAQGTRSADRGFEGGPALRARQSGSVPRRVRGDRARRQRHARRGDRAAERLGALRGPDQQGRHSGRASRTTTTATSTTIKNNLNTLIDAMNEITAAAEQIANGNLTVALKERSPEDKLMQALAAMVAGLTQTVSRDSHHRRRSGIGEPVDLDGVGAGVEGRQLAGGRGRRGLVVDGGDGLQHQAERRQRAADGQDRQQERARRAGERQERCSKRSPR